MNQKPLKLLVHTYSKIIGVPGQGIHGDHYVAGIEPAPFLGESLLVVHLGKGKDIGRLILAPVLPVELLDQFPDFNTLSRKSFTGLFLSLTVLSF